MGWKSLAVYPKENWGAEILSALTFPTDVAGRPSLRRQARARQIAENLELVLKASPC